MPFDRRNIASDCYTIAPSDTQDVTDRFCGGYVGGTGDITVINFSGQSVVFKSVPVSWELPCNVKRIMATGTTATLMVGYLV